MERYQFEKEKAYRLTAITDHEGKDKSKSRSLYRGLIGSVTNFRWDEYPCIGDRYRMKMHFVRNSQDQPVKRCLHSSPVSRVEETEKGLVVHTMYSVYHFEQAKIRRPSFQANDSELIELYLSTDSDACFGAGYYYKGNQRIETLRESVHEGMFRDSVLILRPDNDILCRYLPGWGEVQFYDTCSDGQGNKVPMLIHNTGTDNLCIKFQGYPKSWTIPAGESRRILPYCPEGADPDEEEEAMEWKRDQQQRELSKALQAVEKDRESGKRGCTEEEISIFLNEAIRTAEEHLNGSDGQ